MKPSPWQRNAAYEIVHTPSRNAGTLTLRIMDVLQGNTAIDGLNALVAALGVVIEEVAEKAGDDLGEWCDMAGDNIRDVARQIRETKARQKNGGAR